MAGSGIFKRVFSVHGGGKKTEEDKGNVLSEVKAAFKATPGIPADIVQTEIEDIAAFESVGKGPSLFEGLQQNGMELPPPDQLDELQSECKVMEVLNALAQIRVFLIGFDGMSGRRLYRTLWKRTLWEGCYVKKRHPDAITLIDVSHKMRPSEIRRYLDSIIAENIVH